MLLYIAFGLISKAAEGVASKAVKIHVFDPTVVWRPLSNEPSRISAQTLAETSHRIGLYLFRGQYRSIFIQFFTVSSERRMCFETECIMTLQKVIQGHWFWHQSKARVWLSIRPQ